MFVSSLWVFVPILQHGGRIVNCELSAQEAVFPRHSRTEIHRIVLFYLSFVEFRRISASDCFRFFLQKAPLHAMLYLSLDGKGAAVYWGENM
jgi:hypothetical protein